MKVGAEKRGRPRAARPVRTFSGWGDVLKIEIRWQHNHVANRHAARPCQHERYHVGHFARLEQTSRLLSLLQFFRRPVREQSADDGTRRDRTHTNAVLEHLTSYRL